MLALSDGSEIPPAAGSRAVIAPRSSEESWSTRPAARGAGPRPSDALVLKFEKCEQCDGVETLEKRETRWQVVGIFEEAMAPPTVYVNNSAFTHAAGGVGRATTLLGGNGRR
ncbi:MAG: hypothetical protein U0401_17705 [Anaerolineae bacterium]